MSSNSETHDPFKSIFQCCLKGLTRESNNTRDPTPGLSKILTLLHNGYSTFDDFNGNENPTFSPSEESTCSSVVETRVINSDIDIASDYANTKSLSDEPLEGLLNLNPQRIGSSIYYDTSEKGDTMVGDSSRKPFYLGLNKMKNLSSVPPQRDMMLDSMSGDCVQGGNLKPNKLMIPIESNIHEYYSVAETNVMSVEVSFGELTPTESNESANCSSDENDTLNSKSDDDISGSSSKVDASQETPDADNDAKEAVGTDGINSNSPNEGERNENGDINVANDENKQSIPNEPQVPSTSKGINDSEIQSPAEDHADDVSLYVNQYVGDLTPCSFINTTKFSHDFSHLF